MGTGSALPKKTVENAELSAFLDTSDEWIVQRTGIHSRHIMTDEKLEQLGAQAALRALADAGAQPQDIDYFICSNVVNEYITPSLSSLISSIIGLHCPCIDINCACPGFLYAMDIAQTRYLAGKARNILIVSAEEPTRMCDWADRSTSVLFGDGAGAVVLGEGDAIKGIRLNSSPDPEKIWQRHKLRNTPYLDKEELDSGLQMRGREVFKFAVTASTTEVDALLRDIGMDKSEVDYYLVHQANMRIIEAIRKYMDESPDKFPSNIADHGNSSSASCAILLDECRRKGLFQPGNILVFSAFGAGLLSAAVALEWTLKN